jgi:hypothetical protein
MVGAQSDARQSISWVKMPGGHETVGTSILDPGTVWPFVHGRDKFFLSPAVDCRLRKLIRQPMLSEVSIAATMGCLDCGPKRRNSW